MSTIQGNNSKQLFTNAEKYEAKLAHTAKQTGDPDAYKNQQDKNKQDVIAKDTLSRMAPFEKKSSEELTKLYETYNTDGAEGLTESEFEALFNSVVGETQATSETTATIETNGESKTVTVKPGDTLSKIARDNGVTLAELKEANPHLFKDGKDSAGKTRSAGGNLIYPGDQVKIPQKPKAEEPQKTEEAENDGAKPEETEADKALKVIDETKLTEAPPQLPAEDKASIKESNQKKVADARTALAEIPADHPQRAEAEEKVAKLEGQFKTQYGEYATAESETAAAKATIDQAEFKEISPADLDRMTMDDLQAIMDQDSKTLEGAKAVLEKIPADDPQRAEYESKVQQLEQDFEAAYPSAPEVFASTPEVQEKLDQAAGAASRGDVETQQAALRAAIKAAKTPEDFAAIASAANQGGQPELAEALQAAADPKVSEKVRKEIREALQDGNKTDSDLGDALKNAKSPEDFTAIAAAAKVAENSRYPQLASAIAALAEPNLSPEVRTELRKALDDASNTGSEVLKAIEKAGNQYDQAAIAAVVSTLEGADLAHVQKNVDINQLSPEVARALGMNDWADSIQATLDMEQLLSEKAGHPVDIHWDTDRRLDPGAMMAQLDVLRGALDDPSYETMWGRYNRIEFNTFEGAKDSSDPNNLKSYAQVDGQTLKLNNAADDGLTAAEQDKQRRALEVVRNTGRGT